MTQPISLRLKMQQRKRKQGVIGTRAYLRAKEHAINAEKDKFIEATKALKEIRIAEINQSRWNALGKGIGFVGLLALIGFIVYLGATHDRLAPHLDAIFAGIGGIIAGYIGGRGYQALKSKSEKSDESL